MSTLISTSGAGGLSKLLTGGSGFGETTTRHKR